MDQAVAQTAASTVLQHRRARLVQLLLAAHSLRAQRLWQHLGVAQLPAPQQRAAGVLQRVQRRVRRYARAFVTQQKRNLKGFWDP